MKINLADWEENWVTSLGFWQPGETVLLRGRDIFKDCQDKPWMEVLLYAISGKEFNAAQVNLFERIWSLATSFPDPRLWNNRIGALAGTARCSPALGISAGTAVSEAIVYGQRPIAAAMDFILSTFPQCQSDADIEALVLERLNIKSAAKSSRGRNRKVATLPGFGRPITQKDERIAPLLAEAKAHQLTKCYTDYIVKIEQILVRNDSCLRMNVASLMASLCADQGLDVREFRYYTALCFSIGILACQIDSESKPEGCFLPLRCDRINYIGKAKRQW